MSEPLDALQIVCRDRDEWRRRAHKADAELAEATTRLDECRAMLREREAKLAAWHYRAEIAEQREREAQDVTIAMVVAMLRRRAQSLRGVASQPLADVIAEDADAVERGEWRKLEAHDAKAGRS